MNNDRRSFLQATVLAALGSHIPGVRAESAQQVVRVANGTVLDILSLPDVRTFEYFLPKEGGIQGKVTYVPGAVRAIQAVLADQSDVGIATLGAGLSSVLRGQDIEVFALASGARPYLVPVATKDITELKALEGQDVGVISLVDSTYYLLVMLMRAQGADPEKVRWRAVGGGAGRGNALVSGGVKAGLFQAGQALDLMEKGPFHILPASFQGTRNFIFKTFWAKRSFLENNPALAESIVRANLLSTREALDKQKFMAYAPRALAPMSASTVSRAYDMLLQTGPWDPNNALLNKPAGDSTVEQMVRYKVLAAPVPFEKWATRKYVEAAIAKVGTA